MRDINNAATLSLESDRVSIFALVMIQTPIPILATNCHRELTYSNETYRTDTGLLKLPVINQEFSLSASTLSLNFSDASDNYLAMAMANNLLNAQLDIHLAILDADTDELIQVIPSVARGYLDDIKPGKHTVTFEFKNHMHKFTKTAGRRTNSPSQNRFYPDDHGFDVLTDEANS